jgi:hypothetical protein
MRSSTAYGFDPHGTSSGIEIQKPAVRKTGAENRKEGFFNAVRGWAKSKFLRPVESSTSVGACDYTHTRQHRFE